MIIRVQEIDEYIPDDLIADRPELSGGRSIEYRAGDLVGRMILTYVIPEAHDGVEVSIGEVLDVHIEAVRITQLEVIKTEERATIVCPDAGHQYLIRAPIAFVDPQGMGVVAEIGDWLIPIRHDEEDSKLIDTLWEGVWVSCTIRGMCGWKRGYRYLLDQATKTWGLEK